MTTAGVFTWTPTEAQGPGTYTVEVKVWDDAVEPDYGYEAITITVTEKNTAPTLAAIPPQNIDEGVELSYVVSASDPDVPANNFSYTLIGAPSGTNISPSGTFTWTPTDAQGPGSYTFDVRVRDNGSPPRSAVTAMTVNVNEANIAPTVFPIAAQSVPEGGTLLFAAAAVDPDTPPNAFAFTLSGAPAGATISPTGTFTWSPTEAQGPGTYVFYVVATDNGIPALAGQTEVTVIVDEVNRPPVLSPIAAQTVDEGSQLGVQLVASDPDIPSNSLVYALDGAPNGMTVSASGFITWTPSEEQGPGSFVFDVVVADSGSPVLTDRQSMRITVNDANNAPVISAIGSKTIAEGDTLTFTARATDPDVPANTFWFRLDGAVPAGAAMSSSGEFTWTPNEVQGPGLYKFDVVVTDTGSPSRSSKAHVSVTVLESNQPPLLELTGAYVAEAGVLFALPLVGTDPDLPAQKLTYTIEGLPDGAAIAGEQLVWTPEEAHIGETYSVKITVRDDGIPALETSAFIKVTVVSANLAPVLAPIGDKAVEAGEMLSFQAEATDGDDPPDILTFTLSPEAPAGARIDRVTGRFEWRPTADQDNTAFEFSVIVTDSGSVPKSDSESIVVDVGTPNMKPVLATPADQESIPGESVTLTVTARDPDGFPSALVYSATNLPPGVAIDSTTGLITGQIGFDGLADSPFVVGITVADGAAETFAEFTWRVSGVGDPSAATPTRQAVVSSVSQVRTPQGEPAQVSSDIGRTLVLMARAVRVGADDVSLPFLLLLVVMGAVLTFGRIGLVPLFKRGRRESGMILSYDAAAGTGLVGRDSDGGEVFVHASSIARRDRSVIGNR